MDESLIGVIKGDSSAIIIIFTQHLQRNRNPISFKRQLRHYFTENNNIYWKKVVLEKKLIHVKPRYVNKSYTNRLCTVKVNEWLCLQDKDTLLNCSVLC